MAQVEIFNIEFGETLDSINKLKGDLKEVRKLFNEAKPNTPEFTKYSSEVKRLDSTIKELNNTTKSQVNALGGINTSTKFASGSYGELKQRIDAQKKALLELNTESEDFAATQQGLIKLQEQRIEIEKKIPSLFQERIKGAIDESNALKQLRMDLKAAQSAALNGDGKAAQKVAELKDKIDDLKDATQTFQGSGVERLNTSMGLLTQGFADFDADKIKTGFRGISAAMSAIPIILIIEGIKALIDNFDEVVKFAKQLTGGFNESEKAITKLTKAIEADTIVNNNLISSYDREIALLSAKGVGEEKIIELKKKKIAVEIAEAENQLKLNTLKISATVLNDSFTDSFDRLNKKLFELTGQQEAADIIERTISKSKKERAKEDIAAATEALNKIADLKNSSLILDAEYDKKQIDKAKEKNKTLVELQKENQAREAEIENALIDKEEQSIKDSKERQKKGHEIMIDLEKQFIEDLYDLDIKRINDEIAVAQTKLNNFFINKENTLSAERELLEAHRKLELENTELTEAQKAEIISRYREEDRKLQLEKWESDLQGTANLTNALGNLSDGLYSLKRSNLEKGSEEEKQAAEDQFNANKAFNIAGAVVNTAAAVMNALGTVQPYYAAIAAAAAAGINGAAQIAKISSQKFQYFDGGFTKKGNPTQAAESMGNAQFHNDEYVVPSVVKNKPEAQPHISILESMRRGSKSTGHKISGFFDGGFTQRSVASKSEGNAMAKNNLESFIASLPVPVLRVSDYNKVQTSVEQSINVSSL